MRQDATCSVKPLIFHLRINDERLQYPLIKNRATYLAISLPLDFGPFRCWSDASVEFPPIKFRDRASLISLFAFNYQKALHVKQAGYGSETVMKEGVAGVALCSFSGTTCACWIRVAVF